MATGAYGEKDTPIENQSGAYGADDTPYEAPKPSGALRKAVGDKVVGFASGAVGATKAIADAAGAGNAVSSTLEDVNNGINDYLSPEAKADQQEQSAIMAGASGKGVWEGVKAGAKAFAVAPVQTAVQGLGSIVPVLAGGLAGLPGAAATGIAIGAGTAKGAIYDRIKKEGGTEEDAIQAQAYDGANTDQIALGGALGVADALTGVSRIAGGMVRNAVGKPVVQSATQSAERGVMARMGMGLLGEMPLEAAQGGQEQVASNLAAQRAGYQSGTWDNVASNATLEALASAGPGATFGALDRRTQTTPPAKPPVTPTGDTPPGTPPLQIGNTPDPYVSFADGTVARQSEADAYINGLPPEQQPAARAKLMGLAPQPKAPVTTPAEQAGIDAKAGPLSAAAATAVNSGITPITQAPPDADPVQVARDEYLQQTAAMQAQQDEQAYQAYTNAIAEAESATDEAPGETLAAVSPITNVLGDYDNMTDDEFFAALGATPEEIADAVTSQPSSPQASAANPVSPAPDVAASPLTSAAAVNAKQANLARIQAANRPQPTTLGTQTNAVAGPAFGVNAAMGMSNVQNAAQGTNPTPVEAPGEAPQAVAGNAAATNDIPAAGSGALEGVGVNKPVVQADKAQSATENVAIEPTWWASKPNDEKKLLKKLLGFNAHDGDWASMNADEQRLVEKQYEEFASGNAKVDVAKLASLMGIKKNAKLKQTTTTPPAASTQSAPSEVTSQAQAKQEQAKADMDHLFGVDQKRATAIDRIASGKAWFGNAIKAAEFIHKNGLKDTHQVIKTSAKRFDIQAKDSQPQGNNDVVTPPQAVKTAQEGQKAPAAADVTGRQSRIESTLKSGGKVVDGTLRTNNGMSLMALTETELSSIPDDKKDTSEAIAARGNAVYGKKPVTPQLPPAAPVTKPKIVTDKAEMRPYRKPDGSVGYEAVPIQAETPVESAVKADGQNNELDAEMRSYEAKKYPTYSGEPAKPTAKVEMPSKPDTLSDKEKAAKAKMFNALGKLAALAGKNTRMNWTPEEEQQLLPIVIELFDGAMELGSVTFQKAVRYVREFIASNLDNETADAIPFETLQGAYIATSGRHKDKPVTSKRDVAAFDSLEELENAAEKADTDEKDAPNDSTTTTPTPSLNNPVAEGQRPAGSDTPARGAKPSRARKGRGDDGSVRRDGQLRDDQNLDQGRNADGSGRTDSSDQHEAAGGMEGGLQRVSADFIPDVGGLTREGSWFETAKRNIDLIDLAIQIESENRSATPAEQAQLAKYVGFGASAIRNDLFPVPPAYAKAQEPNRLIWPQYVRNDRFKPLAERIEALPREWQQSILQSSQYAHYTSEGIIRSVWSALQRMGFTGGNVFEPGMGIGSFAMLMPNTIRNTSRYTGVEFDAPTALIARLLSPDQNMIHGDFIKKRFPENFFDVNVGNPPFSQTKILGDPKYAKNGFMLHDFFFAKGIDLVRPGGIQVFVTSKGTMDKQSDKARKYLSDRADLLGAIRLPSTAFEDNAGTSVVTDVIFLRKRAPGESATGEAWAGTASVETKDGPVLVNEYFAKHPEMVLGQQRISGNTDDMGRRINSNGMGGEKYTVVSYDTTANELDAKFAQAIEKLPENAYSVMGQSSQSIKNETAKIDFDPSVKREGVVYTAKDGTIMRVEQGVGRPLEGMVKLSDKDKAWLKGYVGLRDLVQESRFAQLNDGDWAKSLSKLNKAHDAFVKEHGNIKDFRVISRKSTDEDGNVITTEIRVSKNKRLFSEDYDQALVTSLEDITEDGAIVKTPFMQGRTIGKPVSRDIKTIGDALAVSLDENGSLNLDDVARRMKLSVDEVIDSLGSQVYQTPTGQWQLADEYLAGDVVAKLEETEQAARLNPALQRNVDALKAAQPEKLGPSQISAKLGASWIPESHVNEFAEEIGAGSVTFDPKTETWTVQGGNERSARKAGAEYGTAKRSPSKLLESILNSRSIKITQVVDKKTVQDEAATTAANEMAKKIKDKFKGWVWTDTNRASDLVEGYNKHFNNIAPRRFDGSHLTLPGVSLRYKLHPHQLRAIWRQIQTGNTYLAHAVGAGKTIEMIAGGMEQRRLGLIKKPMYVVPNHMLEQFSNEFMELYPLANIMVADDENFSADRRKAFIASATLNNPDAIIITHDAFQRIGVKEESVAPIRDEILADLEIELSETAKDNDSRVRRGQLQQQIEAVTQRFDKIIGSGQKDSTIKFEDMGVDFVYADEAHVFRKLDFHTAQSIKGIDPNGSKRALDMYVKTRILEKSKPGRSFSFASGTPVTNTMGELYTIMRFFAGAELDKSGISTFDAWARQFGEVVAALEPNAAGAYQIIERFAKFDNVPELMSRVRQFMDVLTSDNLGALVKRPDLVGGKPNLNIIPTNAALTEYMKGELARRIEISKAWKPSPNEKGNPDPIVSIITDGRFAAIDPRFFGGKMQEGETSIITEMGDKVVASYHATKNNVYTDKSGKPEAIKGSTQVVFYNLGFGEGAQRSRGFDARSAFTKRLTDGGIPRNEIAWFDDANTDAKKEAVFKDMRSGKLKVLIGSAKKMGPGVNVQKRLAVLHYQDPPWFPADVEQPHGRIIRQGNQNGTVAIEWYTTKGTYQSTMWQMVGRKQRFIDQAFTGDKTMRSMDDLGEASLFEQAAAVASGDPRAIQLAGLKQDVERFERLQAAHASEQISVRTNLNSAKWHVESLQKRISQLSKAFKAIGEKYFAFSAGRVGIREFTKPGEFGQAVKEAFNKVSADAVMSAGLVQDKQIASLGPDILVKMDSSIGKDNTPTGSFDLFVEFGGMSHQLASTAAMGADVDAVGLSRRIFNQINSVASDLSSDRRRLVDEETDVTKLSKKLGAPFEHQQEMAEKYGELKRLEAELKAEGESRPAPLAINSNGDIGKDSDLPVADEAALILSSAQFKDAIGMEPNFTEGYAVVSPGGGVYRNQPSGTFPTKEAAQKWIESQINNGAVFSIRTSTPEQQLPLYQIKRLVESALRGVKNAPAVRVVANPEAIGLTAPLDTVPSGVTLANGDVYVFQSGIGSVLDVYMVVFHELFHKGLQNVMPKADYVAAMQEIAKADSKVRQYASGWSDSKAGKAALAELAEKYSGKELADQYEALAIEEGLARIAEDLKASREMGTKAIRVRRLAAWLAKVADKLGMNRLANSIRAMSYTAAEKFVVDTIGKSGGRGLGGGVKFSAGNASPDIRFRSLDSTLSAAANNVRVNKVVDKLNEHFSHAGTLSFWHKTVGSPFDLAQRSPAFNKVFTAVQGFINSVSFYSNEAADLAPKLLPKLENWRDIAKSPISTEDNKAIQAPIFQGTLSWARDESGKAVKTDVLEAAAANLTTDQKAQRLLRGNHVSEGVLKMWRGLPIEQYEAIINGKYEADMLKAGIVFTDAELKSLFNLTPEQISLYREFRSATDKSLDNMAKSEMLRFGGKDAVALRDMVMDAVDADDAGVLLRDYFLQAAIDEPGRSDELTATANGMIERADKVKKLKEQGYAPLSRFGQYSVDVVVGGERQYFSLFETKHEANQMASKMKMMYGADNVQSGTVSQLEFQLLQGITPESLELFGNMLGLDSTGDEASDKAFQTYLRLTKNNRSAMKRMIHRKGIAGFNEDAGRVLAAFIYSNGRQTAAALHMSDITQAVQDIPQGQGQLKDAAVRLRDYVQNPKEEAQAMRGLLFAQYLGGSVASAFVNFTQPFTVSFPYLSQFGGAKRAAGALMQAMKDQKSGNYELALANALKKADEDGTTQPQAVHELMAQSRGAGTLKSGDGTRTGDALALGGNALSKLALGWGKLFGLAEQVNRRSTYIAAFRMAVADKLADPAAFAKKAVDETQFINNKGNKSRFSRGAVGATLMTFKSYSLNYLELLHRMATRNGKDGKQAAALMLAMLFLMAGAGGMPGADDLDDLIDFFAQRLGYNFSSSKARQEFLEDLFGKAGALFVERGLTGLPGSPIDVSGRMSMGNLIPGTGLLLKKRDHTRDATEILGAMGDMVQRGFKAGDLALDGNIFQAVMMAAPKAVGNFYKGAQMADSGAYKDDKGYKVQDTTLGEAAFKAIGFQPASVSKVQESNYLTQRAKDFYSLKAAEIRARWARGIYEKDQDQVQQARDMMADWNEKNPDQRIQANIPAILKRVREMQKTKKQRIADTAPRAMKEQLRRDIAERATQ